MAQFAHYFIKYKHDIGPHDWEQRQQHLSALFEKNDSIEFSTGEGDDCKVYKYQVYHLNCAPNIIVMRFANDIDIPVERDFKPTTAKDEPSCYVIIDNREKNENGSDSKTQEGVWQPGTGGKDSDKCN